MTFDEPLTAEQARAGDNVIGAFFLVMTSPLWLGAWLRVFHIMGWL